MLPEPARHLIIYCILNAFNASSEEEISIVFELKGAVCLFKSNITTANCILLTRPWSWVLLPS